MAQKLSQSTSETPSASHGLISAVSHSITRWMIAFIPVAICALTFLVILIPVTPSLAETCPPGVGKLHGQCMTRTIDAPNVNGGVLRVKKSTPGLLVSNTTVRGAYRAVETDAGVKTPLIRIVGLAATGLKRDGIRLRDADGARIERFALSHDDPPSTGSDLPQGIAIYAGKGITITNGTVSGFRWTGPGYQNGDGIATEGDTSGTITDVVSTDNSDGGFDLKGVWTLDRLTAERNSRNYRFWHQVNAGTLTSIGGGTAVWVGKAAKVTIARLVVRSDKPVFVLRLDGQAAVSVASCDIQVPARSTLVRTDAGGNRVTLGEGCKL